MIFKTKGRVDWPVPSVSVLVVHPSSNLVTQLADTNLLKPGSPVAPESDHLGLLPSGPDPIRRLPPHRTQPSTPAGTAVLLTASPRRGIQLRCSGLRIQGTASSPSSTTRSHSSSAERICQLGSTSLSLSGFRALSCCGLLIGWQRELRAVRTRPASADRIGVCRMAF
jgi:hypothetical protein